MKRPFCFFWLVGVGGCPLTSHHHVIAPRLSHSSLVICLLSVFHLFRVSSSSPAPITIELPPIQNGRLNVTWQWISTIKQRHNDDDVICLPPGGHFWQFEFNRRWCQSIETKCNAGDLYFFFLSRSTYSVATCSQKRPIRNRNLLICIRLICIRPQIPNFIIFCVLIIQIYSQLISRFIHLDFSFDFF